jgi:hypothetical protein
MPHCTFLGIPFLGFRCGFHKDAGRTSLLPKVHLDLSAINARLLSFHFSWLLRMIWFVSLSGVIDLVKLYFTMITAHILVQIYDNLLVTVPDD